jgi:hypothetical protein
MMRLLTAVLVGPLALAATACGDSPTSPSSDGRFVLRLSASTYSAAPAVLVTFTRVRALSSSGSAMDVPLPGGAAQFTCDLRRLQASDGEIAVGTLPPGDYGEVRLQIQSATLYLDNPSDTACAANFRVPSGRAVSMSVTPNEVSLNRTFRLEAGTDTAMRIALNSEQTIRAGGGGTFTFQPVLTILSVS